MCICVVNIYVEIWRIGIKVRYPGLDTVKAHTATDT